MLYYSLHMHKLFQENKHFNTAIPALDYDAKRTESRAKFKFRKLKAHSYQRKHLVKGAETRIRWNFNRKQTSNFPVASTRRHTHTVAKRAGLPPTYTHP